MLRMLQAQSIEERKAKNSREKKMLNYKIRTGNGFCICETITQHTYSSYKNAPKQFECVHSIGRAFNAIDFMPNMEIIYLLFNYSIDSVRVEVFDRKKKAVWNEHQ